MNRRSRHNGTDTPPGATRDAGRNAGEANDVRHRTRAMRTTPGRRWLDRPGSTPGRSLVLLVVILALISPFSGCAAKDRADGPPGTSGYTSASLYPANVTSIAVPIFENRTLVTGIEREVTDALIKELQLRTPYSVVTPDRADTILGGVIVSASKTRLSTQRGSGLVQEVLREVTVDFEWKDLHSGRVLARRQDFTAGEVYIPSQPVGEPVETGEYGAAAKLARDIVSAMRDDW